MILVVCSQIANRVAVHTVIISLIAYTVVTNTGVPQAGTLIKLNLNKWKSPSTNQSLSANSFERKI